ncbi:replication-relaxation family protein [Paenibacillus sp. Leaf72]|uniref:replication-relaxation family protein n=1 Tax=Paenibacillus sp. Leaf72 TaxID=1736234 RepID=UPI0006F57E52|nr:replication-relaxation family protein [Paenibacillus sp. Leaf72]KQN97012.1 hypothetical protein ASF12_23370 [Paenibacillus sp. Leaf72]
MANKIKNLTKRDWSILISLYRYRTFTTPQVHELFFSENKKRDYCWKRMHQLRHDGYIISKPVVENGRKVTHSYFLTAKSIESLHAAGHIEKIAYTKDLRLDGHRMIQAHMVNNLYVQLNKYGYELWDSRQVKAAYELDRNSLIQACLITPDLEKHGVYLLVNDPEEKTVAQIITEIKKHVMIENVIILCKSPEAFDKFERVIKKEEVRIRSSVMCLPLDVGMILFKTMFTAHDIAEVYREYGTINYNVNGLFPYTIMHKGERKYIVELLSQKTKIRKQIMNYNPHEYKRDGKKLIILTWSGFRPDIEREFEKYTHFEYETVAMRYLEHKLEVKRKTLSESPKNVGFK